MPFAGLVGSHRAPSVYGTVFTRESTRIQQQDNLNQAILAA
jgi:hypothetical protein